MSASPPSAQALRVSDLPQNSQTAFEIVPDSAALSGLAKMLGVDALRKLRFSGVVGAQGTSDWRLDGQLGATVVQPCGVTLAPVTTRIDVPVTRLYLSDYVDPDAPEVEMPEDETIEPLGPWIDPEAVMIEALSLAIPEYPRAAGAALGETVLTEPGAQPLRDADLKPFAGLAALRSQLENDSDSD